MAVFALEKRPSLFDELWVIKKKKQSLKLWNRVNYRVSLEVLVRSG